MIHVDKVKGAHTCKKNNNNNTTVKIKGLHHYKQNRIHKFLKKTIGLNPKDH